ncbi:DUF2812 domain-containing protein [Undibacterium sp. Di26W]|uniref:DUF2812 domain-containing protein n=1 Tax=Undibacterium sp. Di26W TaxID=3413035 RepID=UPI003BF145B9
MSETLIKKFKCFWSWEDEKEQLWLQEMASQGLHLKGRNFFGVYGFVQGEPADIVYGLDYIPGLNMDFATTMEPDVNYKQFHNQLIADAGWEHVLEAAGWQYWRMPMRNGKVPEIYTDTVSKRSKYKRLLWDMCIWNLALLPTALYPQNELRKLDHSLLAYIVYCGIVMPISLYLLYASLRVYLRMRHLQKRDEMLKIGG